MMLDWWPITVHKMQSARPSESLVICEGWLHKLKQDIDPDDGPRAPPSLFKGWLKRFFQLRGDRMYYYHAPPKSSSDKATWSVALADISVIEAAVPAQNRDHPALSLPFFQLGQQWIIKLTTPLRPLVLRAENRTDYDRWLQVLRVHVSVRRQRLGLPPCSGIGWSSSLGANTACKPSPVSGMVVARRASSDLPATSSSTSATPSVSAAGTAANTPGSDVGSAGSGVVAHTAPVSPTRQHVPVSSSPLGLASTTTAAASPSHGAVAGRPSGVLAGASVSSRSDRVAAVAAGTGLTAGLHSPSPAIGAQTMHSPTGDRSGAARHGYMGSSHGGGAGTLDSMQLSTTGSVVTLSGLNLGNLSASSTSAEAHPGSLLKFQSPGSAFGTALSLDGFNSVPSLHLGASQAAGLSPPLDAWSAQAVVPATGATAASQRSPKHGRTQPSSAASSYSNIGSGFGSSSSPGTGPGVLSQVPADEVVTVAANDMTGPAQTSLHSSAIGIGITRTNSQAGTGVLSQSRAAGFHEPMRLSQDSQASELSEAVLDEVRNSPGVRQGYGSDPSALSFDAQARREMTVGDAVVMYGGPDGQARSMFGHLAGMRRSRSLSEGDAAKAGTDGQQAARRTETSPRPLTPQHGPSSAAHSPHGAGHAAWTGLAHDSAGLRLQLSRQASKELGVDATDTAPTLTDMPGLYGDMPGMIGALDASPLPSRPASGVT